MTQHVRETLLSFARRMRLLDEGAWEEDIIRWQEQCHAQEQLEERGESRDILEDDDNEDV